MKIRSSKRVLAVITATALFTGLGVAAFGVDDAKEVRQADFINSLGAGSQGEADVRTKGSYEFLEEGLHITTNDHTSAPADSNNKIAEYWAPRGGPTDIPTTYTQDWFGDGPVQPTSDNSHPVEPGKQIVFDVDQTSGNGNDYNILVGEPVYGTNWWLTNGSSAAAKAADPSGADNSGNGSDYFGTLAQWKAALPDAKVYAYGFSLGSGVKGEGVIRSQTVDGDDYIFTDEEASAPSQVENPVTASATWNNSNRVARINMTSAPQPANDTGRGTKVKWEIFIAGVRYYVAMDGWGDTTTWAYKFGTAGGSVKVDLKRNGVLYGTRYITTN